MAMAIKSPRMMTSAAPGRHRPNLSATAMLISSQANQMKALRVMSVVGGCSWKVSGRAFSA